MVSACPALVVPSGCAVNVSWLAFSEAIAFGSAPTPLRLMLNGAEDEKVNLIDPLPVPLCGGVKVMPKSTCEPAATVTGALPLTSVYAAPVSETVFTTKLVLPVLYTLTTCTALVVATG